MPRMKIDAKLRKLKIQKVYQEVKKAAPKRLTVEELSRRTMISRNFITRNTKGRHIVLNKARIEYILEKKREKLLLSEEIEKAGFLCYETFYRACLSLYGKNPSKLFELDKNGSGV